MVDFLKAIDLPSLTTLDRARSILWFLNYNGDTNGLTGVSICKIIEAVGHPEQNISRLTKQMSKDKQNICRVPGKNTWRLRPHTQINMDQLLDSVGPLPKKIKSTDSILPTGLFKGTRSYIEKVVLQINASYDAGLFDCCAVMCRRLLETLIIEVYENSNRSKFIQTPKGNFFMFADLLRVFDTDNTFTMSRNGKTGLNEFKKLGDLSAHNRRFNARQEDISRVQNGIRIATEELLHLANLI